MAEFTFHNGHLCEVVNGCTCYGGGPYGHEPGCGLSEIADITELLADHERKVAERAWDEGAEATGEHIDNGGEWALPNPYRAEAIERKETE